MTLPVTVRDTSYAVVGSPIGELVLTGSDEGLSGLHMGMPSGAPLSGWRRDDAAFHDTTEQLRSYFAAELREFDLTVAPHGTAFQLEVWQALRAIPYGQTRSYGRLAAALGRPGASRAIGLANGSNPIAIVVPCHRVIGADGSLTGYGGGLARKQWLLGMERGEPQLPLDG